MSDQATSCDNCPNLLGPEEARQYFGRALGGDVSMCAARGIPLTPPTGPNGAVSATGTDNLREALARNCPDYGRKASPTVSWGKINSEVLVVTSPPEERDNLITGPRTCQGCQFFAPADVVAAETGWLGGICSAKGKVIFDNRKSHEARDCDLGQVGMPMGSIGDLWLLPVYQEARNTLDENTPMAASVVQEVVDPRTYESDVPVTAEMTKSGIRAYRRITDAASGNSVLLPIYDPSIFSAEEQSKIPQIGDEEHPEDYVDHIGAVYKVAVLWQHLDETPAAWGEAGTGKTELYRHMAWLMQVPFERISITASTELDDLAGKMHFIEGTGTKFEYGRLPQAWTKPCVLVIDEPNTGPNEVWQFLRPLTDNSKQLVMDMNSGERLSRHEACYLGMAMNPAWDFKNIGANQIGDADANRLMHIGISLPDPTVEKQIITKRCTHDGYQIESETLETVMRIAADIRQHIEQGELQMTWAVRPQIKVARALRWFDFMSAYRMACADYLEPEQADIVMNIVRTHIPSARRGGK